MLQSSTLTLSGTDNFVVDGLVGDLNANPTSAAPLTTLTGSLEITTGDAGDDTIDITTGAGSTTIDGNSVAATGSALDTVTVHAAAMLESSTLTLSGTDNFVVAWPGRRPQRQPDLGRPADHAEDYTVTGLVAPRRQPRDHHRRRRQRHDRHHHRRRQHHDRRQQRRRHRHALDTVTVHAAAMLESSTLTLSGTDNFVVDGLVGDLNANSVSGNVTVSSGAADSFITTGSADDTIKGGGGADTLDGGAGNDRITYDGDDVSIDGGIGNDTLVVNGAATIDLLSATDQTSGDNAIVVGFENVDASGSGVAVTLIGSMRNILIGGSGNDTIIGGGGADTLDGGAGNDRITYDGDDVSIDGGIGNDTLVVNGAATIDLLSATDQTSGDNAIVVGFENVDAFGSGVAVTLIGSNDENILTGGSATTQSSAAARTTKSIIS